MKAAGVKTVGYIGYNDAWGDLVYNALKKTADPAGIQIVANERYARAGYLGDRTGVAHRCRRAGSGDDRRFRNARRAAVHCAGRARLQRQIYGTHGADQSGFHPRRRARGRGRDCPAGPVVVADQLPDILSDQESFAWNTKRPTRRRITSRRAAASARMRSTPGWCVLDSSKRALATGAKPGTPEFRTALRDALVSAKGVVGTHGIYNFTPGTTFGVDKRALVLVKLVDGKWKLMQYRLTPRAPSSGWSGTLR